MAAIRSMLQLDRAGTFGLKKNPSVNKTKVNFHEKNLSSMDSDELKEYS
jgi:hypothetical protein